MYGGPEGMYVRYVWGFVRAVEEYPHQAVRARVESGEMCVTSIKGGYPTGGVTDAAMSVVSESHRGSVGGRGGRPGAERSRLEERLLRTRARLILCAASLIADDAVEKAGIGGLRECPEEGPGHLTCRGCHWRGQWWGC